MRVEQIMTQDPVCCTRETTLRDVARLMVEYDCGAIPVVDNKNGMRVVGVVTDRDITCRIVAMGKNPQEVTAGQCMSNPVITATPEMDADDCCELMEENQVRRIPVVDGEGCCCGMVSQADIARKAPNWETAEVVKEVSRPSDSASRVAGGGYF